MFIPLLGVVIAAGVCAYIFVPYLLEWDRGAGSSYPPMDGSREALMMQLADLEYDFRAGKLREEDYRALRREIELRLLASEGDGGEDTSSGP